MVIAIDVDSSLWNKTLNLLKSDGWVETFKYVHFDAGIDFDFVVLKKNGEEVLFGWDNWVEGEIQASEKLIKSIELLVGNIFKKGKPINLKPEVINLLRSATKGSKF